MISCYQSEECYYEVLFYLFLTKMGHSRPLLLYFRLFITQLTVNKCSI